MYHKKYIEMYGVRLWKLDQTLHCLMIQAWQLLV